MSVPKTKKMDDALKTFENGVEKVVKVAEGQLLKVCRAEALEEVQQQRSQDVDLRAKVGICEPHAGGVREQLVPAVGYGLYKGERTGCHGAVESVATLAVAQQSSQYGDIPRVDSARLDFHLCHRYVRWVFVVV